MDFLPVLIAKVNAAHEATLQTANALKDLADYLQTLVPKDFRNKPSDIYRPR